MNLLRPLRLLIPFVAIAAALGLFLGVGFVLFSTGGGAGRSQSYGPCDAGLAGGSSGIRASNLSEEQRRNAATIIQTARDMGAPPRAWLVALATAMQESTLRNINYGDRDSLGLFQQRPSQGWGSPNQI
ncbi:MAG TPA: NlpC/P60 family protein, partial [Pseudonocardia sp.]